MKLRPSFTSNNAKRIWVKARHLYHLFLPTKYIVETKGKFIYFLDPGTKDTNFNFYLPTGEKVGSWFEENGRGRMTCVVDFKNIEDPRPVIFGEVTTTATLKFTDPKTAMVFKLLFGGNL